MKIVSLHGQLTFDEMKESLEGLPKTNRWVILVDTMPWIELEKLYGKQLNNSERGADNITARTVIAALFIKHRLNLSDRETIDTIQENPYMQYMCGLTEYTDQRIFDPIRNRITIGDINDMTLKLMEKARKKDEGDDKCEGGNDVNGVVAKTLPSDLKADATCADADVRYPTDIDLIKDGSKYIDRMMDKVCGHRGIRKPVTAERIRIRSIFLNVIKRTIQAVIGMCHQQEEMLRLVSHTCGNRIIRIHQPHLRPIVRGKARFKVEFGARICLGRVRGYPFIAYQSWDSYNESSDIALHIDLFKECFGENPGRFFGDRVYLSRDHRKILKEKEIEIIGRPLGCPPKNPSAEQLERERVGVSLRNEAGAQFGTGKRAYGANNIRAKLLDTAWC